MVFQYFEPVVFELDLVIYPIPKFTSPAFGYCDIASLIRLAGSDIDKRIDTYRHILERQFLMGQVVLVKNACRRSPPGCGRRSVIGIYPGILHRQIQHGIVKGVVYLGGTRTAAADYPGRRTGCCTRSREHGSSLHINLLKDLFGHLCRITEILRNDRIIPLFPVYDIGGIKTPLRIVQHTVQRIGKHLQPQTVFENVVIQAVPNLETDVFVCGIDWPGLDVHDLAILYHGSLHIIDGIGIVRIGDSGAFAQCGSIYGSPRRRCLVQHRLFIELGTGKAQKKKYRQKESVSFHRDMNFG